MRVAGGDDAGQTGQSDDGQEGPASRGRRTPMRVTRRETTKAAAMTPMAKGRKARPAWMGL